MLSVLITGCNNSDTNEALTGWELSKSEQKPVNVIGSAYNDPAPLSIGTAGWEDGIYMSRDGLNIYAVYVEMDLLKAVIDGATPDKFYLYQRGPDLGQDFTNPLSEPHPWIHGDVVIGQRNSVSGTFSSWRVTGLKRQFYNRGAPQGILNASDPSKYDYFFYTDDSSGCTRIYMITNSPLDPSTPGSALNMTDSASNRQDNPHAERYDTLHPERLVLFYESDNRPGASGAQDIWYTTSNDSGATWASPVAVSSVNTTAYDGQPHLFYDGSWWLYCTRLNPADGKLAIYRYSQGVPGDWNSWASPEIIVSAGSTQGVGEPSITASGDLYFVVIFRNTENPTAYDLYDGDPWVMKRK